MKSDITSRRVTWIALALSLLSAGVGHVYARMPCRRLNTLFGRPSLHTEAT